MVEVFKTDLEEKAQSEILFSILTKAFPAVRINFDLSDCDRVLRVEGEHIEALSIMMLVKESGFKCELLD